MDALAPLMTECFPDTPDVTPYTALPANVPLDELNPPPQKMSAAERRWAEQSLAQDFSRIDRADEDTLNRILWHAARGRDDTYPDWAVLADPEDDDD